MRSRRACLTGSGGQVGQRRGHSRPAGAFGGYQPNQPTWSVCNVACFWHFTVEPSIGLAGHGGLNNEVPAVAQDVDSRLQRLVGALESRRLLEYVMPTSAARAGCECVWQVSVARNKIIE